MKDADICLVTGYGGAPHEAPPTVSYSALLLAAEELQDSTDPRSHEG